MSDRVLPLRALVMACGLALAGCGGMSGVEEPLHCPVDSPYVGGPLHAPLPPGVLPLGRPSGEASPVPAELERRLNAQVQALQARTGAPAISASVHVEGAGRWSAVSGNARV